MPITSVNVWDAKIHLATPDPDAKDKRPSYVVEGRITNQDESKTIGKVVITIWLNRKSDKIQIDKDKIDIDSQIPPGGTQAFARIVHLLPPEKAEEFSWGYEPSEIVERRQESHGPH